MEFLFGRKKTPEEMLRENQRMLKKAMRCVTLDILGYLGYSRFKDGLS